MPRHLLFAALTLEFFSAVTLFLPWHWGLQALLYLLLHASATPWLARGLWHQLPRRYRVPAKKSILFLTVMIFTMPFVGFLGVLWGLMMALRLPRLRRSLPVQQLGIPPLPFQAPHVHTQLPYSAGALNQILRQSASPLKRVKAVMAMRQMPLQRALPGLNIALRDRVDDVRLLAYAMRDSAEKSITEQIQLWQDDLDELPASKQAAVFSLLAQNCFELVYSGLVQGAVKAHWLKQALIFAQKAVQQQNPSASNYILLARVHLMMAQFESAAAALDQAQSCGASCSSVAIWRAECAFGLRQFAHVQEQLALVDMHGDRGSELSSVKSYWRPDHD